MLLVLTFYGPSPGLDLVVAVGAHFGVWTGVCELIKVVMSILGVALAMSRSLLGHHSIEVVPSHRCRTIVLVHVVVLWHVLLLLLE